MKEYKDFPRTLKNLNEVSQVSNHVVWVNGCFDIIHAGHIDMLKYARSLGQYLVVGLDTDERVRSSKGPTRPINTLEHRIKVMDAIRWVDEVVEFGSDAQLIASMSASNASTIVVGEEYKGYVIGSDVVDDVVFFPRLYGLSTTKIAGE